MSFLLDTNTCIGYLNGTSALVRARLAGLDEGDICLCSVVKAELFFGVLKSARPDENMGKLRLFTDRFASLPFDDAAVEHYGRIRLALEKSGRPIGPNDLLIASVALAHDCTIVTHNTSEFSRVPGLLTADWEA